MGRRKRIVDSAKRTQKTVSGLYETREKNRGRGRFRLLGEDARLRMKACTCACVRARERVSDNAPNSPLFP